MYYEVDFSEFFTLQFFFGVMQFFVNIGHGIENRFTNSITTHSWFHRTDQGTELVENFFEFFVLQIFGPWLALKS